MALWVLTACGLHSALLLILLCIPSAVAHDLVHLVRLGDVQLAPLGHLLEVRAFVEGAAQPRFPGGWVRLVRALVVFALVDGPSPEESGVLLLPVVLLGRVLPGDAEERPLAVLPAQPRVAAAVDLRDQPLLLVSLPKSNTAPAQTGAVT